MHRKNQQDTGLIPLFLNEANWRGRDDSPSVYRFLYCSLSTGFREKVEAYNVFIALEGLDIGHRVVAVSLCGTALLP
jgi:hypothetical protein